MVRAKQDSIRLEIAEIVKSMTLTENKLTLLAKLLNYLALHDPTMEIAHYLPVMSQDELLSEIESSRQTILAYADEMGHDSDLDVKGMMQQIANGQYGEANREIQSQMVAARRQHADEMA